MSIKADEHERRSSTSQIRKTFGPDQLSKFLANGRNKEQLNEFFFEQWCLSADLFNGIELFVMHGEMCHEILNAQVNLVHELSTYDHEEADTRLLLHIHHISKTKPNSKVLIISSDTDVAILLLSLGGTISVEALHLHTDMKRSECILDIKTI